MKKILILSSLFSGEIYLNFDQLKKLIKSEFCYISPLTIIGEVTKNFSERFLAASISLSREFENFVETTKEKRPEAKALIYFGSATKDARFDEIYVVGYTKLNTQEGFMKSFLPVDLYNKFYLSTDAVKEFNTIAEVLEFIEKNV